MATNHHFVAFFAQFEGFTYNPTKSVATEYKRLTQTPDWKNKINRRSAVEDYRIALVLQFNDTYGIDESSLESWQNLCRALEVSDIPDNAAACRKLVRGLHVNLVDLVDMPNTHKPVRQFSSVKELSKYSKKHKKIFPRDEAKAGGILKHLLRQIAVPRV